MKYNHPREYYCKDKKLEEARDYAVMCNFDNMTKKEIFDWAKELADFFEFPKEEIKFKNVQEAMTFIIVYYKR